MQMSRPILYCPLNSLNEPKMRTIAVLTTSRADYGILRPVITALFQSPEIALQLLVSGTHLSSEFGMTVNEIEQDGFKIDQRIEMLLGSDSPQSIGKSMGMGVISFAQVFAQARPDLLLLLGDRFEVLSAALAALPVGIPIGHIHGGELTEGLIDDAIRHSLTKLSHYHFAATADYARRIRQLGEEAWRIVVCGAPSLDNISKISPADRRELSEATGLSLDDGVRPLLVTFHPVTLQFGQVKKQVDELIAALNRFDHPTIITFPNADTNSHYVIEQMKAFAASKDQVSICINLGTRLYFSLMSISAAMIGNSSSGIIEAASFTLPVVNIGIRQRGRFHGRNVVDCDCKRDEIESALRRAISPEFRSSLADFQNPYGDGKAAERILSVLTTCRLDEDVVTKKFQDVLV